MLSIRWWCRAADVERAEWLLLALLGLMALGGGAAVVTGAWQPRGIRNNNPGNIRWDGKTQWQGLAGVDDAGFVIFDTPENGIRAMARVLASYGRRGVVTVADIIRTWAPPNENNTPAYIASVETRTGLSAAQPVPRERLADFLAAIIHHENGQQPYTAAQIEQGIRAA